MINMEKMTKNIKPIIKYAGGKRMILNQLIQYFPKEFNNYYEPFIGGGSVLFELCNLNLLNSKNIYICDISEPLINMYIIIRDCSIDLIDELKNDELYKNDKDVFYKNRIRFNELKLKNTIDLTIKEKIEYAALYIYLNRVCFNGIYRENSKGEYNVPFGKQKNPLICNEDLIIMLSKFFLDNKVEINTNDYSVIEKSVKKDDFIYMDPPYYNTFTGYNKEQFNKDSQIKLMQFYKKLTLLGCKVALSNSDTEFIRTLYNTIPNVKIIEIDVKRVINSKAENRKNKVKELLITNY